MTMGDPDVVEECSLNVLVPEASNFDPASFCDPNESRGQGQDEQRSISVIPRRKVLYFGMVRVIEQSDQSSYSFLGF